MNGRRLAGNLLDLVERLLRNYMLFSDVCKEHNEGKKMTETEKKIAAGFRTALEARLSVSDVIVFGSRARGDADEYSDLDVVVVLDEEATESVRDYVSDCAWHAGFEEGIVVVPVVFSNQEWQMGAVRNSLLAKAVKMEGQSV